MDTQTARTLNNLTCEFYRTQAGSFSQTRQHAWTGWQRVLDEISAVDCAIATKDLLNILDLGCGNLRFERFIENCDKMHNTNTVAYAIDNCSSLVQQEPDTTTLTIHFQDLDIISALIEKDNLTQTIDAPLCDLSVSFGFFHHIPGIDNRTQALDALINKTRSGGFVVVSFWQFLNSSKLRNKAVKTTKSGCASAHIDPSKLDENDYLLDWQQNRDVLRYCHHFAESEIDTLAQTFSDRTCEIARFSADGKNNNLNRYLILQVN